jgi:hypothetical protein
MTPRVLPQISEQMVPVAIRQNSENPEISASYGSGMAIAF